MPPAGSAPQRSTPVTLQSRSDGGGKADGSHAADLVRALAGLTALSGLPGLAACGGGGEATPNTKPDQAPRLGVLRPGDLSLQEGLRVVAGRQAAGEPRCSAREAPQRPLHLHRPAPLRPGLPGWTAGNPHVKTPHLDRLAGEGVLFERATPPTRSAPPPGPASSPGATRGPTACGATGCPCRGTRASSPGPWRTPATTAGWWASCTWGPASGSAPSPATTTASGLPLGARPVPPLAENAYHHWLQARAPGAVRARRAGGLGAPAGIYGAT